MSSKMVPKVFRTCSAVACKKSTVDLKGLKENIPGIQLKHLQPRHEISATTLTKLLYLHSPGQILIQLILSDPPDSTLEKSHGSHVGRFVPAWFAWFSDKWKGSTFPLGGGASIGPSCKTLFWGKMGELIETKKFSKCVHLNNTYTYDTWCLLYVI